VSGVRPNGFVVHWTGLAGATKYQVWIEPGSRPSGPLGPGVRRYTARGLPPGRRYTVKLDALVRGTWTTARRRTAKTAAGHAPAATRARAAATIAAPVNPGPTITQMGSMGINVIGRQDIADKVIDGTGDTGVIFEPGSDGSTLSRVKMTRIAAGDSVSWGKHGIYAKARNLLIQDADISCSSYCASDISLRFDGDHVNRFRVTGAALALTYYEESFTPGTVTVENGSGTFTSDTAIWMDNDPDYGTPKVIQHFVFRNLSFTGPGAFMKVASGHFAGSVYAEHCFLNGHPVTAADFPNVPNVTITP
jgi:hypothetical protein